MADLIVAETPMQRAMPADSIYELHEGAVDLTHVTADGLRQVIGFAFPRDLIGVATKGRYFYDVEALSRVSVYRYTRAEFNNRIQDLPDVRERLQSMLTDLLASFVGQLSVLGRRSADSRAACFVLMLARRAPRLQVNGVDVVCLQMPRDDIAAVPWYGDGNDLPLIRKSAAR